MMRKAYKRLAACAMMALVLLCASCAKTNEQLLIGTWAVESAMQTTATADSTVSAPMPGYEEYTMEFFDDGLCVVTDHTTKFAYEWYLLNDRTLILVAEVTSVQMEYEIEQLDKKRMVCSSHYTYPDADAGGEVSVTQRFEWARKG